MAPLTRHQLYELLFWTEHGFTAKVVADLGGFPRAEAARACEAFYWRGHFPEKCKFKTYLAKARELGTPCTIHEICDDDGVWHTRTLMRTPLTLRDWMARPKEVEEEEPAKEEPVTVEAEEPVKAEEKPRKEKRARVEEEEAKPVNKEDVVVPPPPENCEYSPEDWAFYYRMCNGLDVA